jgi:hypothetical protein
MNTTTEDYLTGLKIRILCPSSLTSGDITLLESLPIHEAMKRLYADAVWELYTDNNFGYSSALHFLELDHNKYDPLISEWLSLYEKLQSKPQRRDVYIVGRRHGMSLTLRTKVIKRSIGAQVGEAGLDSGEHAIEETTRKGVLIVREDEKLETEEVESESDDDPRLKQLDPSSLIDKVKEVDSNFYKAFINATHKDVLNLVTWASLIPRARSVLAFHDSYIQFIKSVIDARISQLEHNRTARIGNFHMASKIVIATLTAIVALFTGLSAFNQ